MTFFPVTHSNLSATHLASFLKEKYDIDEEIQCRIIKAGVNHTYLVTGKNEKYIFRVYCLNWRTQSEIEEEIILLIQLKENNISVSCPISDKRNNFIQTLHAPEGDRFGVLFTYAKGEKLLNTSAEDHYRIGELMGRLHTVTHNQKLDRVHYTPEVLLIQPLKQLEKFLNQDTDEMKFMYRAKNYLVSEFAKTDSTKIKEGIVHLDMWFDNINISTNNDITIFDFDFCGNGWLCLDIAYYIMQLHNVEKYEAKEYQPKVDSFIKGYETIMEISDEEKRLIPMLGVSLYFFYLGIQCERFDNWSNSFLNESYLKRFILGLVKRYTDIYLEIPD